MTLLELALFLSPKRNVSKAFTCRTFLKNPERTVIVRKVHRMTVAGYQSNPGRSPL